MSVPVSYYNEISNMMFGFGDSHIPNPETVRTVESITLNQLRLIVREALKVRDRCGRAKDTDTTSQLDAEELVFLMRKNKHKMRRFLKYLHTARRAPSKTGTIFHIPTSSEAERHKYDTLIKFIELIDETGELTDLRAEDEVKHERMLRADRMSATMEDDTYMKFARARTASFKQKSMSQIRNFERMRAWIDPSASVRMADLAVDVLSYYAYETVAQLIDYALLVRMDHQRQPDPLANLQGTHYAANMFRGEQFNGPNPDCSRVLNGQPPIAVAEIREVMRRWYAPQAGRLRFGRRLPESQNIIAI